MTITDTNTPVDYVVADATGKIIIKGRVPFFMLEAQPLQTGQSIVQGDADPATDYVLKGVITPRPANPTTLTGMKLLNVPNPSTVTIDGVNPQQVTDGEVDLSFTQPGTYTITVSSWPMLDASFRVTQP
jgi:hypothetical protein